MSVIFNVNLRELTVFNQLMLTLPPHSGTK